MKRVIVVRRGAAEIYELLHAKYGHAPATLIIYDRRRESSLPPTRPDKRWPQDAAILATRGFYVDHSRPGDARPLAK